MTVDALVPAGRLSTTARRLDDVVVLTIRGTLDPTHPVESGSSVEATMAAVDAALETAPRLVVADLARVEVSRFVVGLLGLVRRRTARFGVPLVLAALSPAGQDEFLRARVAPLYPAYPTVRSALGMLDWPSTLA